MVILYNNNDLGSLSSKAITTSNIRSQSVSYTDSAFMSNYSTRVNDNAYEYTHTTIKQAFDRTIQKVIDSQTSSTRLC